MYITYLTYFLSFSIVGSGVFTPVSITASTTYPSSLGTGAALHQLPSVISKPKVIVTNGTQVMLNGPSGPQSRSNGAAHTDMKKDPTSQNPGKTIESYKP